MVVQKIVNWKDINKEEEEKKKINKYLCTKLEKINNISCIYKKNSIYM